MAIPKTHFAGEYPACFSSLEQYTEWKELARISCENLHHAGPCTDCTKEFQERMIDEDRCENQQVVFRMFPVRANGKIIGHELCGCVL